MKKIKLVCISQATGGVQRHLVSVLENINRDRFDITCICPPQDLIKGVSFNKESFLDALKRIGIKAYPVDMHREIRPLSDLSAFFKIYNFIKKEKFNVAATYSSKAGFLGRIAAKLAGATVVVHMPQSFAFDRPNSQWLQKVFYALLESFAGYFCDKIMAVCDGEKRLAMKFLGIPPHKIEIIPNAVNLSGYDLKADSRAQREKLGIGGADKFVLLVGRMAPQKAPLDFIKVAAMVKKHFSNVKFVLLGDGPLSSAVTNYIEKNKQSDFIKYLGWHNDPKAVTAASDIFVLSSLWEVLPNHSLLDAMALGKPVVTTNTLGAKDLVVDSYNGFVVAKGNPKRLAEAILKLLELDAETFRAYGVRSRQILEKKDSLTDVVRKIENLYEELLRNKNVQID